MTGLFLAALVLRLPIVPTHPLRNENMASVCMGEPFREIKGVREFSGYVIAQPVGSPKPVGASVSAGRVVDRLSTAGLEVIKLPAGANESQFAAQLMTSGSYSFVDPDWICHPLGLPNDPMFGQQWHLVQSGLLGARGLVTGGSVTIAIVDTGVDVTHPDLQNRVPGYDAFADKAEVDGGDITDHVGHGTEVTGVACATGNNGIGVCGVGWNLPFMPVRVSNSPSGTARLDKIVRGITWAVAHGAKVVNVSMSGVETQSSLITGNLAWDSGTIVVWGAGNGGVDTRTLQPSLYDWDYDHVVVVGASDSSDQKASFSNYGRAVDVFAPGVDIVTTGLGGTFVTQSGTSLAAPIVSGILALQFTMNPLQSLDTAMFALQHGCLDVGGSPRPGESGFSAADYRPGNDERYGWGRVNAMEALQPSEIEYVVTAIPKLPGTTGSRGTAVNDRGDVAGVCLTSSGAHVPFLWTGGASAIAIPNLSGIPDTTDLMDINDNRTALLGMAGSTLAALWHADTGLTFFENPPTGFVTTVPLDLNNSDIAVGYIEGQLLTEPRRWQAGIADAAPFWDEWRVARSINKWGDIAGDGPTGWFVALADPNMDYRATAAGGNPTHMSDSGTVVSDAGLRSDYWLTNGYRYSLSAPTPGASLHLSGVNEFDEAVGYESGSTENAVVANLLLGSRRLADLVRSMPDWAQLIDARQINNAGEIVGTGIRTGNSRQRAFIARPSRVINLEHPIYLGALPPALVVEFRHADGQTSYGVSFTLDTLGSSSFDITVPAAVTGSFRLYLRATNILGDRYYGGPGPGWLGVLYPPPSVTTALPRDTRHIDFGRMVGSDIDSSNSVDIGDYAILATAYGSSLGDPHYLWSADINHDGSIDIGDLAILSQDFNKEGDD
jgi:subtilisin family serine protease